MGLGAILGHTAGLGIRSDHLLFFDMLGGVAGAAVSLAVFYVWRSTQV